MDKIKEQQTKVTGIIESNDKLFTELTAAEKGQKEAVEYLSQVKVELDTLLAEKAIYDGRVTSNDKTKELGKKLTSMIGL